MKDEKISGFLTQQGIEWKFNLHPAPWWGRQFETLIGLVKGSLYKTIANGLLSWMELQEVLLDVQVALNNRLLDYVEDDIQPPILTPSSLLHIQPNTLPELEPNHIQDYDLRKHAKYLSKCKDAVRTRWTKEYLKGSTRDTALSTRVTVPIHRKEMWLSSSPMIRTVLSGNWEW